MYLSRPFADYQAQRVWAARDRRRLALGLEIVVPRDPNAPVDAQRSVYFRQADIVRVRSLLNRSSLDPHTRLLVKSEVPVHRDFPPGMVTFRFKEIGLLNRFFKSIEYEKLVQSENPLDEDLVQCFNTLVQKCRISYASPTAVNQDAPPRGPSNAADMFDPPRGPARDAVDPVSYPPLGPVRNAGDSVSYFPREVQTSRTRPREVRFSDAPPSDPPPVIRQSIVVDTQPRAPAPRASRGLWGSCAVM